MRQGALAAGALGADSGTMAIVGALLGGSLAATAQAADRDGLQRDAGGRHQARFHRAGGAQRDHLQRLDGQRHRGAPGRP